MARQKSPKTDKKIIDENIDIDLSDTLEDLEDNQPTSINTGEIYPSLDELFGDGSADVKIEIYRVEPKVYKGEDVAGYVGLLQVGDDMELLRQKFGGGKYRLQQKINNRFADQMLITIAGQPRAELVPFSVRGKNAQPLAATPAVVDTDLNVNGIPIGGSMADFEESLKRIAMIKSIFPADVNTSLLNLLLDRQQSVVENPNGNMVDQLKSFVEITTMLKPETTASTNGGSTIYDLGREALQAFMKFLEVSQSGGAKMNVGTPVATVPTLNQKTELKPEQQPTALIQANGQKTVDQTGTNTETVADNGIESDELAAMNVNQIAEKAGSYIVAGFIQDPQQTAAETAEVLKIALPPLPEAVKKQLKMFQTPLFNMAKSILTNQIETEPEEIEKFRLFFDEVFCMFVIADDNLNQKGTQIE